MKYYAVNFGVEETPRLVRQGNYGHYSEEGISLCFEGRIFSLPGFGKVASWAPAEIARRLALKLRRSGEWILPDIEGDFSLVFVSRSQTSAYRSLLSPFQIYYSASSLSNHLMHAAPNGQPPSPDEEYLRKFLFYRCFNYSFIPNTPLLGVQRVRGGHLVQFRADGKIERVRALSKRAYKPYENVSQKEEDVAPQILALIEDGVRDHLAYLKNRPVVCEISGGLDSSFIAALLARQAGTISGYMFTYPASPSHRASEACAQELANYCGIDLKLIDPGQLQSLQLSDRHPYCDEPSPVFWQGTLFGKTMADLWGNDSAIFSGVGSDQLFLRTPGYLFHLLRSGRLNRFHSTVAETAASQCRSRLNFYYQTALAMLPRHAVARLAQKTKRWTFDPFGDCELIPELVLYEPIEWMTGPSDIEVYLDSELAEFEESVVCEEFQRQIFYGGGDMVFAPHLEPNGSEYLSPFVDLRLVDFMFNRTSLHLIHDWARLPKSLLRAAQKGVVPDSVRLRPKSEFHFDGFQVSLLQKNESYIRSLVLEDKTVLSLGWFSRPAILRSLEQLHFGVRNRSTLRLVSLIGYLIWWRDFSGYFSTSATARNWEPLLSARVGESK